MKPLLFLSLAAVAHAATPVSDITVPPGFKVELLREAGPREGSWISMALDAEGRIYISPQGSIPESGMAKDSKWGGLWRSTVAEGKVAAWEKVPVPVGDSMGMLWAFDSLYVSGNGPEGRGIYRCKDTDGDSLPDTAVMWKKVPGGAGEHGAHALVLSPDKKNIYIVHGNSTGLIDGIAPDSPYRNWGEDDLIPKLKDPTATFFDNIKAPYGYVLRTDEDGKKWELIAGGFRNPYDIDFNADGELFTYDSDMEWDRGLPWYRPTRVLHIVPGGEYGFREGSAKWPAYYPDSLPAVVDVGLGCPTGVKFGTAATGWPEKYRRAFFACDWTYGRILAVHMREKGASYTATNVLKSTTFPKDAESSADVEPFVVGKGMPVTDVEFLKDGSMVFTTGGRGTSAGLYRVSWVGKEQPAAETKMSSFERHVANSRIDELDTKLWDTENEIRFIDPTAPGLEPTSTSSEKLGSLKRELDKLNAEYAEILNPKRTNNIGNVAPYRDGFEVLRDPEALARLSKKEWEQYALRLERYLARGGRAYGIPDDFRKDYLRYDRIRAVVESESEQHRTFKALTWSRHERDDAVKVSISLSVIPTFPPRAAFGKLLGFVSSPGVAHYQSEVLESLKAFPLAKLPDDEKLLKLRILQLTFARHGRPSLEWQKLGLEKLLASYPAKGERAAELNRELSQLLIWLSQPELGDMNPAASEKKGAPAPSGAAPIPSGVAPPADGAAPKSSGVTPPARGDAPISSVDAPPARGDAPISSVDAPPARGDAPMSSVDAPPARGDAPISSVDTPPARGDGPISSVDAPPVRGIAPKSSVDAPLARGDAPISSRDALPTAMDAPGSCEGALLAVGDAPVSSGDPVGNGKSGVAAGSDGGKPQTSAPKTANSSDKPVANPGATVHAGRKGADFHAELGREVIERTLALMDEAKSQEEQIHYALVLRWAHGWTPQQRERYFRWFHEKGARLSGGNSLAGFIRKIHTEAAGRVPDSEKAALAKWLAPLTSPAAEAVKPRAFVKAWTLADLEKDLDALKDRKPDLARGRELYAAAQCSRCHLFKDAGGNVGPDLSAVAQRFQRRDILEAIVDPNKVVSDQYALTTLTVIKFGGGEEQVTGLLQEETSGTIRILTDPFAGTSREFYHNVVKKKEKAAVSLMPPALLNTLTAEEVADLLAFLGGR